MGELKFLWTTRLVLTWIDGKWETLTPFPRVIISPKLDELVGQKEKNETSIFSFKNIE